MADHDLELRLYAWYRAEIDDNQSAPSELRTDLATLAEAAAVSRPRLLERWRFPVIVQLAPFALATAAVVVALVIGMNLLLPRPNDVGPSIGPSATPATPAPSPTPSVAPPPVLEGRLLFSRRSEARGTWTGMFTIATDGSDEQQVLQPGPDAGGRWSTSGQEIAVPTTLPDGRIGTAILAADGTVLRILEIPDPTLNVGCTVWSPDDTRLVCEAWDNGDPARRGIYAVSAADGSNLVRLTESPAGIGDFPGDVSIDGQLVFKRGPVDGGRGPLWLVPLAGGQPVQLTADSYDDPGRFNPDGQLIATSVRTQLAILGRDGIVVFEPNNQGRSDFGPDWSPDGDWIVFSSGVTGPFADLYISHPDGSARFVVKTTADNEIAVDWGRAP